MINYLSIDFESWAYPDLSQFKNLSCEERKELDDGYVKMSAQEILKILAKHKTKLTFFVLGELYNWYPEIIEKIAQEGHEIAYHTHAHDILRSNGDLVDSLKRSKNFLTRFRPRGFRAPTIFIKEDHFKILKEYGFQYDSSIYGQYSTRQERSGIIELPVTKIYCLPFGSGYFTAVFGKKLILIYNLVNRGGNPMITFVHNWQIVKPKKATFPTRNYLLKKPHYVPYTFEIKDTFEYLLQKFSFAPMLNLVRNQ